MLELLARNLSNKEIASPCWWVKRPSSGVKNLLAKLSAATRKQAVSRARIWASHGRELISLPVFMPETQYRVHDSAPPQRGIWCRDCDIGPSNGAIASFVAMRLQTDLQDWIERFS